MRIPPKPQPKPKEVVAPSSERRIGVLKERRWGTLRCAALAFDGPAYPDSYLPEGHKIIASRQLEGSIYIEHIVQGPDMPVHVSGSEPTQVFMIFATDDSGALHCWWEHMDYKRWPVSPSVYPG